MTIRFRTTIGISNFIDISNTLKSYSICIYKQQKITLPFLTFCSEIIEMERRANAILNGRKRSTILSTSISSKPKSNDSSSDVKKNRYTFSLLRKGSRQESDDNLNFDIKKHQGFKLTNQSEVKESLEEKDRADMNKSPSLTVQGSTGSDLIVSSGIISNTGRKFFLLVCINYYDI